RERQASPHSGTRTGAAREANSRVARTFSSAGPLGRRSGQDARLASTPTSAADLRVEGRQTGGKTMSRACKLAAAFAAILTVSTVQAQVADNSVKIGVLTDLSGPASDATGQGSVVAAQMAVEDFGGKVAGVPIELVSANHQLKPDIGSEIATRWY